MTAIFYTSNVITCICCLAFGWAVYFHGRHYDKDVLLLRRYVAAVFTIVGLQRLSLCSIVWPQGVEVFASRPSILMGIAFIILALGGTALMGRSYHRNFALWVLLLLLPSVFLVVNSIMLLSGLYNPLLNYHELLEFRATTPSIYYGRMFFVAFLLVFWNLTMCMLIEAYIHYRRLRASCPMSEDAESHRSQVHFVNMWGVLIILGTIPLTFPNLWPHIVLNVILLAALVYSALGYQKLIRFLMAKAEGRLAPILITQRVPWLLNREEGGATAWGTIAAQNPFYSSNPHMEDTAQVLGLTDGELTDYLESQHTDFTSWITGLRLQHAAEQLRTTDRKIADISTGCGYNDPSTFTRAFFKQFGKTPSEYRKGGANT